MFVVLGFVLFSDLLLRFWFFWCVFWFSVVFFVLLLNIWCTVMLPLLHFLICYVFGVALAFLGLLMWFVFMGHLGSHAPFLLPWVSSWLQTAAPCDCGDCGLPGCDCGCGSGSVETPSFYGRLENWPALEPYWRALPHSPATQPARHKQTHTHSGYNSL